MTTTNTNTKKITWQKVRKKNNSHCRDRVHYAVSDTTPESTPKGWNASYVCRWSIAAGKRPVPFRTRKLSLHTLMVLQPGGCGRVSHRRHQTTKTQQNTETKKGKETVNHRLLPLFRVLPGHASHDGAWPHTLIGFSPHGTAHTCPGQWQATNPKPVLLPPLAGVVRLWGSLRI